MNFKRDELLAASEVARYIYCKRAWWYDREFRIRQQNQRLLGIVPRSILRWVAVAILIVAMVTVLILIWQ